ncbi:MAG: glycosyltransferase family 2 protein [Cytophagales bacterium]|nr:glycosyltransferase family 2 protein [Cytophagales bacterium]
MKISVITVCYNSVLTLERTIQSVISQHYQDIEYIIIDGCSTDGTLDIINKYQNVINKYLSEPDGGVYHAMNKGIALCTGDIVAILNSDDIFADQDVLTQVSAAFKASEADCVYGDLQYIQANKVLRHWTSGKYNKNNFLWGWMPPHPAFFCKRSLYNNHGLFNTYFRLSADYELMLRFLYKGGASAYYISMVLVKMQTGGMSNKDVKNRILAYHEDKQAWSINELKPYFFTILLKKLIKLKQFFIFS